MEVICYVCNEKTSDWHRNLVETKSVHSNTPIIAFIDKFLDNYVSHRNMNDESNCICSDCLFRIYSYDWMCMNLKEQENELRTLILKTEDCFTNNIFKSEVEFDNSTELDEENCAVIQPDIINTEDSLDGTKEIEIGQATVIKIETPADNDYDEGDEVENDIHKAKSVDAPLHLMVAELPTHNRSNRQRTQPKRYINEHESRTQVSTPSAPKCKNRTQKRPHQNKRSNSSDNQISEQEATQNQEKFECHKCGSSYSHKIGLNQHKRLKHAKMVSKYVCPLCDVECSVPYTLRDHLKDVHRKIVTLEYAKDQKKLYHNTVNLINQKPKIKRQKVTCKCDVVCSGFANFKRHVKNMHGLNNWMKEIKSKE